ncbi:hypothetical protein FRC02_003344 [Tulasnella sp. 418]|nr:hypothetical protein FRC02_003344 [Tulasnella sp. 418]
MGIGLLERRIRPSYPIGRVIRVFTNSPAIVADGCWSVHTMFGVPYSDAHLKPTLPHVQQGLCTSFHRPSTIRFDYPFIFAKPTQMHFVAALVVGDVKPHEELLYL